MCSKYKENCFLQSLWTIDCQPLFLLVKKHYNHSIVLTAKEEAPATSPASDDKTTEGKNVEEGALSSSSAEGLAKSSSSEDSLDKKEASPATEAPEGKTSAEPSQTSEGSTKEESLPTVTVTPSVGDAASTTETAGSSKDDVSSSGDVDQLNKKVASSSEASAPSEGDADPSTRTVSPSSVDISLSSEDVTPSNQDSEASKSDKAEAVLVEKYSGSSLSDSTKPSECSSLETISEEEAKTTRKEETEKVFAKGAHERILGLLGALLPQDSKVSKC